VYADHAKVLVEALTESTELIWTESGYHVPVGFHFIMLLKSCVSCSSAHGSLRSSSWDWVAPEACGVCGWVSPRGVEAALAFAFFRGGILDGNDVELWSEE
jgi:hypothetical protein